MQSIPHFMPDIFIYFHLRNLIPQGHFLRGALMRLQHRLSKMEIDFVLEPKKENSSLYQPKNIIL